MILDASDVTLPEMRVQAAVRDAFAQLGTGRAVQPSQTLTEVPGGGDVIAYQALLAEAGVYAVKVSPYLPQPDGAAVVTAWTMLVSTRTGRPLLLTEASSLTTERTAATTALAIELLARPDARTLAVIGLGPVGRAHLRHARAARAFVDVRVWSRTATQADLDGLGEVSLEGSAEAAVAGADVVLLCTSAATPLLDVTGLPAGTLVTSISTNAPLAHEIDPAALASLDVYADHASSAYAAAGEMQIAAAEHGFTVDAIRGDLAGLLTGSTSLPTGDKPVFFRSVGLGIEDAAIALTLLEHHQESQQNQRSQEPTS